MVLSDGAEEKNKERQLKTVRMCFDLDAEILRVKIFEFLLYSL